MVSEWDKIQPRRQKGIVIADWNELQLRKKGKKVEAGSQLLRRSDIKRNKRTLPIAQERKTAEKQKTFERELYEELARTKSKARKQ